MAFKVSTIFPDYFFEGRLETTTEINNLINLGISKSFSSGITVETSFGKISDKQFPLHENLKKLQILIGDYFINESNKVLEVYKREVNICNPYLISTNPGHSYPINIEKNRWYNACVWLQTTTKGSHLILEDFSSKIYASPNLLQPEHLIIKPQKNKIVFWPSHIPWGLTTNFSDMETICYICTFDAKMKKQYLTKR